MATTKTQIVHEGDNVFHDVEKAREWAEKHNAGGPTLRRIASLASITAQSAREPLVYHTIVHPVEDAEALDAVTHTSCLLMKPARELVDDCFLHLPPNPSSPLFQVRSMKGDVLYKPSEKGLFATAPIPAGAAIVSERPLLVSPAYIPLGGLPVSKAQLYKTLFARLPDGLRSRALAMANCRDADKCKREEGIVRTNGMTIHLSPDARDEDVYSAVFGVTGRCNHDCSPNALYRWDIHTFSLTLYAVRAIQREEQITIAYTDILAPRQQRVARLRAAYNFNCRCASCRLPADDGKKSDKNRAALLYWLAQPEEPSFSHWYALTKPGLPNAPLARDFWKTAAPVFKSLREERLDVLRRQFARLADSVARTQGALGQPGPFGKTTKIAIECWRVDAAWSELSRKRVRTYENWLSDPKTYNRWETRKEPDVPAKENAK